MTLILETHGHALCSGRQVKYIVDDDAKKKKKKFQKGWLNENGLKY